MYLNNWPWHSLIKLSFQSKVDLIPFLWSLPQRFISMQWTNSVEKWEIGWILRTKTSPDQTQGIKEYMQSSKCRKNVNDMSFKISNEIKRVSKKIENQCWMMLILSAEPLTPQLFRLLVTSTLGFKAGVFYLMYTTDSSDSPLLWYLPTSWCPVWQLNPPYPLTFSSIVRSQTRDTVCFRLSYYGSTQILQRFYDSFSSQSVDK